MKAKTKLPYRSVGVLLLLLVVQKRMRVWDVIRRTA